MDFKYYLEKLWLKAVYLLLVILYLVNLNKLNKELLACNFDDAFVLLEYNDCAPVKYFVCAVFLFGIGCFIIFYEIRKLKMEAEDFEEILISICTIIVIVFFLYLIFCFINNPILRAILIAISLISVGIEAMTA